MRSRVTIPIGTRFGLLTVAANDVRVQSGDGKFRWGCLLKCDCGGERTETNGRVNHKDRPLVHCSTSCGLHWRKNPEGITSGAVKGWPGWYKSYNAMKARCKKEPCPGDNWERYGGSGIEVCDKWLKDPLAFYADMGDRPESPIGWNSTMPYWTIDRIDSNGNYEPGNCRWADPGTQAQNKRTTRE